MLIDGWDLLILKDGAATLLLYGRRPGDPTPRAEPVGPLPAEAARRLAGWMCKSGPVDAEEVVRRAGRPAGAGMATR